MASDYKKIAEENQVRYGSDPEYRRFFYEQLYKEKTHFVYEFIQNAVDSKSCQLELRLGENELFVWNDGDQFSEKDVRSICSLGSSSKDLTQIGTFGIGFKSVYNYTDYPEIYSGDERFRIRDLTQPEGIDKMTPQIVEQVSQGRIVFRLPFKDELSQKDIVLLKDQFCKLGERQVLLFLRDLKRDFKRDFKTIRWTDERDGQTGICFCNHCAHSKIQNASEVELTMSLNGENHLSEMFLVFHKSVQPPQDVIEVLLQQTRHEEKRQKIQQSAEKQQPIEIAFKLHEGSITAMDDNCVLFAYLPTQKETHLKFLIQARYQTTSGRADIQDPSENPWNRWLVQETAKFLPEILEQLKASDLLEPSFFNVLPLSGDDKVRTDDKVPLEFEPIVKVLEDAMGKKPLVPTQDGGYAKAENVFYPESTRLRKLVKSSGMHSDSSLLHPYIRKDAKESERCFDVMAKAGVKEIKASDLLCWLERQSFEWFKNRTDEWLSSLYIYFNREWSDSQLERVKQLPLVRLENGEHMRVSDQLVYFPPNTDEARDEIGPFLNELPILRSTLLKGEDHSNINAFLREKLGVKMLSSRSLIIESICPLYSQPNKPAKMKNRRHVRYIFKSWQKAVESERSRLEESVSKVPILRAYKGIQREASDFVVPCNAYLPQVYTGDDDLETYFSVYDGELWFVDDKYLTNRSDTKAWLQFLKAIGAMDTPRILKMKVDGSHEGCKKRGISGQNITWTGEEIIEDRELIRLSMVLYEIRENNNYHLAQSLWCLLVKSAPLAESDRDTFFKGTYRWKYRSNSSFKFDRFDATFYRQLKSTAWIPDKQGNLHKPSECFAPTSENRELLGDSVFYLPDSFNISTGTATWLAKQLGIGVKIDDKDVLKRLRDLSDTDVSVKEVEPLYRFLYDNRPRRRVESVFTTRSYMADAIPSWRQTFKEESLIFIPEPKPHWWLTDEVFWKNEREVFGDDCGYLEAHYGEHLKSFFTNSLEVSECAGTLDYIRGIKDIATIGQAKLSDRKRLEILYRSLWMSLQKENNWEEDEEWIQMREESCWFGKKENEWGFFSLQKLVWRDDDLRSELFKNDIPFWAFDNDLLEFAKKLGVKGCYQDSDVKFDYSGNEEEDIRWSAEVRSLEQDIYNFLHSPHLCGKRDKEKSVEILARLSVRRVEKLVVKFELKGVSVPNPNPRQSFLKKMGQEAIIWLASEADENQYAWLIGDALQEYFGDVKELNGFVEGLLTKDRESVLNRWKQKGLQTNIDVQAPEEDSKKGERKLEGPVDDKLTDEFNSPNADTAADESDVRIPTDNEDNDSVEDGIDESEVHFSNDESNDSTVDESEGEASIDNGMLEIGRTNSDSPSEKPETHVDLPSDMETPTTTTQTADDGAEHGTPEVNGNPGIDNGDPNSVAEKSKNRTYTPRTSGPSRSGEPWKNTSSGESGVESHGENSSKETELPAKDTYTSPHARKEIENIGMEYARCYEKKQDRTPKDVSSENRGYDIYSTSSDGKNRCIEVKARADRALVVLTFNEWSVAEQLKDDYFLYVVLNASTEPELYIIQNPTDKVAVDKRYDVRYQVPLSEITEHGEPV